MPISFTKQLAKNFPHLSRWTRRLGGLNTVPSSSQSTTDSDPSLANRIQWSHIPSGPEGTRQTLALMSRLAKTAVSDNDFVLWISQHLGSNPAIDVIDHFIRRNFRYRRENEEIVRTPQMMAETFNQNGFFDGDCDDVATLTAAILRVYGYPARFAAIRYDASNPEFQHVYVESGPHSSFVYHPEYILDATVAPGTHYNAIERMTYAV